MSWVYLHLVTVVPAIVIGAALLLSPKGTVNHRRWGKRYMVCMLLTAFITLAMPAHVGPVWLNHFGLLHLLSLLVICSVVGALWAVRLGNIEAHRRSMQGLYLGGIVVAGAFTLLPGRLMHQWMFGL